MIHRLAIELVNKMQKRQLNYQFNKHPMCPCAVLIAISQGSLQCRVARLVSWLELDQWIFIRSPNFIVGSMWSFSSEWSNRSISKGVCNMHRPLHCEAQTDDQDQRTGQTVVSMKATSFARWREDLQTKAWGHHTTLGPPLWVGHLSPPMHQLSFDFLANILWLS